MKNLNNWLAVSKDLKERPLYKDIKNYEDKIVNLETKDLLSYLDLIFSEVDRLELENDKLYNDLSECQERICG